MLAALYLSYCIPTNIWTVGFRQLLKQMKFFSIITVCVDSCHNDVMTWILQIRRFFLVWVVSMEAIFSCINFKHDDGFLSYSMPEVLQIL